MIRFQWRYRIMNQILRSLKFFSKNNEWRSLHTKIQPSDRFFIRYLPRSRRKITIVDGWGTNLEVAPPFSSSSPLLFLPVFLLCFPSIHPMTSPHSRPRRGDWVKVQKLMRGWWRQHWGLDRWLWCSRRASGSVAWNLGGRRAIEEEETERMRLGERGRWLEEMARCSIGVNLRSEWKKDEGGWGFGFQLPAFMDVSSGTGANWWKEDLMLACEEVGRIVTERTNDE